MKKLLATLILAAGVFFGSGSALATDKYTLDPAHTTVAFLINHVGYAKTLGLFTDVSGSFSFDQSSGSISDVLITVATGSVNTANEARDKHVRNKDFLNVKKYPEMSFSAPSASIDSEGVGEIEGQLTLLDKTLPLTLSVTLNKAEKYPFGHKRFTLGVSASGRLNRGDYGMSYGVANGLVGDLVELIIEAEAIAEK